MEKKAVVGSVVLSTDQGLGYLAKDFFDNGIIDKVYIHEHSSRPAHRDWYPRQSVVSSIDQLIEECDTLLFFETPFDWKIIPKAREKKTKTVLMVMYECTTRPLPYVPDLVLSPSSLDRDYYPDSEQVTVPVSANFRLRETAKVFVHNAGNGGLGGRNGTREVLDAWQYVASPAKLIVRSQVPIKTPTDPRIEVRVGTFDDIWHEGDVFIFPEKFNGLSLPLQEAFASGMLVMAGDRYPMNTWLPKAPLISVSHYSKERIACEFDCAHYDPRTIAMNVDFWYNKDISQYSLLGREWGSNNSWRALKERYEALMSPLSEVRVS